MTLAAGIGSWAAGDPDRVAIVSDRATLTFGRLDDAQRRLAGALLAAGLVVGDRIAVVATNEPETLVITMGALRAGIVPVPVNALSTEREMAYVIGDSGARWLFSDVPGGADHAVERTIRPSSELATMLEEAVAADVCDFARGRPMHYTSGTTGHPKGVWIEPYTSEVAASMSSDFRSFWDLRSTDVHLVCSPLAHSAPHRYAMRTLEAGGRVVLPERFRVPDAVEAIETHRVTTTFMVPTHLERIVDEPAATRASLASVRRLFHAGAPIRAQTKRRVLDLFPAGSVCEFYSATENHFTRVEADEWIRRPGTVGLPRTGARLIIKDEAGAALPSGTIGEIWLDDPAAERFEYWGDPEKTAAAWDGTAFTVGDHGHADEAGYLFVSGRREDLIISGGVNVYAREVEDVMGEHPDVADVCVYGAADPEWGQRVEALVVARGAAAPEELIAWARERLAPFKVPKKITLVDSLDRTATGKVRRPAG